MKKSLFYVAAASALMLTACSSENDVLQTATPTQQQTVVERAVGFDIYTPAASNVTRAGLEGTMTTGRLQRSEANGGGFGVYAYLVEDAKDAAGEATDYVTWMSRTTPAKGPNFMNNEKLLWNDVNLGWYYNPLKYWPNETNNDSQTSPAEMQTMGSKKHLDRLSFFAYAPYVEKGNVSEPGIMRVTDNGGRLNTFTVSASGENVILGTVEPSIQYMSALTDPNKAVDLLWGVAPAGGLTYTAVNGQTVTVKEGEPLIDMTKPNVNTNMKFLFQHALARINVNAVAAIDQVGAGGSLDPNTKITIDEITITGYFGETGVLNLDNTVASVANWNTINNIAISSKAASEFPTLNTWATNATLSRSTITISTANEAIAQHLRFVGTHAAPAQQVDRVGVTTVRQTVIEPATYSASTPWTSGKSYAANALAYSETTPYYLDDATCASPATATIAGKSGYMIFTIDSKGNYKAIGTTTTLTYPDVNEYYLVKFKKLAAGDLATYTGKQIYYLSKDTGFGGAIDATDVLSPYPEGTAAKTNAWAIEVNAGNELKEKAEPKYATAGTYYKRDANYFMVVPTNNIQYLKNLTDDQEKALRTVRVQIKYYITTEDSNLAAQRAQSENIITKDVLLPSLANGKSYNLNLILGLTSVKIEAEVDDWKVVNSQVDLPQNTAD